MKNRASEKIKWILAFALIFALAISVFALFNPNCIFGHDYVNGVCADCGNVCEHKEIKNGKCVACKKEIKNMTDEEIKETDSGVTDLATGEALYSNRSYAVRNMLFASPTALSSTAYEGITVSATITPNYATNKKVDWVLAFENPDSEWATGKNVYDYAAVVPTEDGALTAVVSCKAPFGERIVLTVVSRDNPNAKASCTLDYARVYEGATVKFGDRVLTAGDNYFDFGTGTEKGHTGKLSIEYKFSDVYTIDRVSSDVYKSMSAPKNSVTLNQKINDTYDFSNVTFYIGFPQEIGEYFTGGTKANVDFEFNLDFIADAASFLFYKTSDSSTQESVRVLSEGEFLSILKAAKNSGKDCLFSISVGIFSGELVEYRFCFGDIPDIPVENIELNKDNVVVNK